MKTSKQHGLLFKALKDRRHKVRREAPIDVEIHMGDGRIVDGVEVDILVKDTLVVEVNGGYHNDPEQRKFDILRRNGLETLGYEVLRFTNGEIDKDLPSVVQRIESALPGHPKTIAKWEVK